MMNRVSKNKASLYFFVLSGLIVWMMGGTFHSRAQEPVIAEQEGAHEIVDSLEITTDSLEIKPDSVSGRSFPRPNRSVTPVDVDDNKPPVVMHYYDKHGDPLPEPVMFLATLDTVTKPKSRPIYPLYNGVSIGVNFADAITMAAGQSYGSFDVWADVSLHNWFFPILECGIGFANSSPENSNFTYKTRPSFYVKAGINYNFLYKSNPAYQCFLGLRAGYSNYVYDVDNIQIGSDYWGEQQDFSMKGIRAQSFYGEAVAGIKVKIVDRFSLGWTLRYHFKFKTFSDSLSNPWFIPGYGAASPISFTLSAIYTLPGGEPRKLSLEERVEEYN